MTHCPECGAEMDQIMPMLYRCPKCGSYYLVFIDSEWGDLYAVVYLPKYIIEHLIERERKRVDKQ